MAKSVKATKNVDTKELFEALKLLESEKGIPQDILAARITNAIVTAVKKDFGGRDIIFCSIDFEKEKFNLHARKLVVEEVEDVYTEILPEEAVKYNKKAVVGDFIEIPINSRVCGRIIAQNAKQIIRQAISDAEKGQTLAEFQDKNRELVTAKVVGVDARTGNVVLMVGKSELILPKAEQVEGETLKMGDIVKVYIVGIKEGEKGGPRVMISRSHPNLVKRLFEIEVPEIFDGTIVIKSISRQAGSRTKMAVWSENPDVDAVGSCIGPRGSRVASIVEELGGEKIDIVKYSEDPATFIAEALSPAKVVGVEIISEEPKVCKVTVPDLQLSLAIGNKGQNARLAVKLTGWKIDIHPESGFYGE